MTKQSFVTTAIQYSDVASRPRHDKKRRSREQVDRVKRRGERIAGMLGAIITLSSIKWNVASQTVRGLRYVVTLSSPGLVCSCPANAWGKMICKHAFAVHCRMVKAGCKTNKTVLGRCILLYAPAAHIGKWWPAWFLCTCPENISLHVRPAVCPHVRDTSEKYIQPEQHLRAPQRQIQGQAQMYTGPQVREPGHNIDDCGIP